MSADSKKRLFRGAFAVALCLVVWAMGFEWPELPAANTIDMSYMQALGIALKRRMQFGSDVLFTFGPLGYLCSSPYDPDLFWLKVIVAEYAFKLAVAALFVRAALRLVHPIEAGLYAVALCVPAMRSDSWWFLASLAAVAWIGGERGRSWPRIALAMLILILIALVKFTYFAYAGACAAAMLGVLASARSKRSTVLGALLLIALFVAIWSAIGQSPLNIPQYVSRSLELAGGYSEAMSKPVMARDLWLVALVLALSLVVAALHVACDRRSLERWMMAALFACGTFVSFKAGYVRTDGAVIPFAFGAVAPFLIAGAHAEGGARHLALVRALAIARCACCLASLAGGVAVGYGLSSPVDAAWMSYGRFTANARAALAPFEMRRSLEEQLAARRQAYRAPRIAAEVGDATIEAFSWEHGFLFLNELRWQPRPVAQAFAVFTVAMTQRNAELMESPRAPAFVLLRSGTIDGRLPGMDDIRSLEVLLRDYGAVLEEKGFLLFRRRPDAPRRTSDVRATVVEKTIHFGERVDIGALEGRCHVLQLDIRPRLRGKFRTLFFQSEPLMMEIESSEGWRTTFRIVPSMIAAGALANPLLMDQESWIRWESGESVPRIASLRVLPPSSASWYEDEIGLRVTRCDTLAPQADEKLAARLRWSMFETPPDEITASLPAQRGLFREREEVLIVNTPSKMRFELEPGRYRLRGQFGFMREAVGLHTSDGAGFRVMLEEDQVAPRVLFERFLDPDRKPDDRFLQSMDVSFEVRSHARALLITDPGPAGDSTADGVFWTGVGFAREP